MLAIYLAMLETEQDQRRFTRLFEAHEKKIYAVALHILGNQTQAEDAAQQTWLKLVQNWERISALPWKETEGYAVTAANNCALDILRSERRTTAFPEDWEPARETGQEEYRYLISLIRSLPENYRRVLELKCVEEQTNREIARRLGMNESTVAVRVLWGRVMLRERLEKEGYKQSFPMEVNFVPMLHPTNEVKIIIAEKATFNSLTDFLQTEFYKGLAIENAPRRCHNCGQYFLLTSGYNIPQLDSLRSIALPQLFPTPCGRDCDSCAPYCPRDHRLWFLHVAYVHPFSSS